MASVLMVLKYYY